MPFWVDVERSQALLDRHYIYRDLLDWTFWPDLSTNGIPLQYYQAYTALANAYRVLGDAQASNDAVLRARDFVEVALGPIDLPAIAAPPADNPSRPVEIPGDTEAAPGGGGR